MIARRSLPSVGRTTSTRNRLAVATARSSRQCGTSGTRSSIALPSLRAKSSTCAMFSSHPRAAYRAKQQFRAPPSADLAHAGAVSVPQVKRNVQINQAEKAPLTTLTGGHTNSNTQRHALAHPQAVHRTRAGRRGGSRAARAFGTVGGKPYFHGIRLLERRRVSCTHARMQSCAHTHAHTHARTDKAPDAEAWFRQPNGRPRGGQRSLQRSRCICNS